ncbi:Por secretion system C-terminal sorting domain-containing protein [Ekhidna lutea]|uniref:Por secretion system C-terminal sorting domain-containing protein n=1 Tax=Ekhidna lutea TaxID=447679 RepID=A0A239J6X1_EKHLU|nr:T9SS type A sorting domain-containing protein [Ekhidna lutea]SNT01641.1 Por secretion system C-terminal sorting domain-containing protein [Ekhidna lutea]
MRNKLIILTFALALSGTTLAQGGSDLQEIKVSIYPNPAVESIVVEFDRNLDNPEFELNSMIGNKLTIRPEEVGIGKYKIPVKELATGYYFLIVKDEEKRFRKAFKFLKH